MAELSQKKRQINELNRQMDEKRTKLDHIKSRIDQIHTESANRGRLEILNLGSMPKKPFDDKRFKASVLGGFFGGVAGFGIVLMVGLSVAANLPPDLLQYYNISPEMVFVTLLAMVVTPTGLVLFGWQPAIN